MKNYILVLLALVSLTATKSEAKGCDWSGVKVSQNVQWRSYYKYYAQGLESDSCTEFFWMFTYRNGKGQLVTDTFDYNKNITEFEINLKGEFKLRLHAVNKCKGCDTTWSFYLVQATFPNANWGYGMKDCKRHIFEANKITNQDEKCVQVYWYVYDNVGNEIHVDSGYRVDYTFPWEGKFEVYCQWWNKCLKQDTFWGRDFDIYCDSTTMSTTQFNKPEAKLIGIYDVLGRPVEAIRGYSNSRNLFLGRCVMDRSNR